MNPLTIAQALVAIATPLAALLSVLNRRRRLRAEVRENLELLGDLEKHSAFRGDLPVAGWLQGKITLDVARLSGHTIGARKKPIEKGTLAFALLVGLGFAYWTYRIVNDGFVWYSVFPGSIAFLLLVSAAALTTNREIPPDQDPDPPAGALPTGVGGLREQVAAGETLAAADPVNERFKHDGQVGIALRFLAAMHGSRYLDAWKLADPTWRLCRVQSWLWNVHRDYGRAEIQALADSLARSQQPADIWGTFVASETRQLAEAWRAYQPDKMGAASNRRRIAPDCDLVILAPLGANASGYYVDRATAIPDALTFTLRRAEDGWRLVNHLGGAPPAPGWPPSWWASGDHAMDDAPDP